MPGSEVYGEKRISVEVRFVGNGNLLYSKCDEKRRGRNQYYDFEEAKSTDSRQYFTPKGDEIVAEKIDSFTTLLKADYHIILNTSALLNFS